MLLFKMLIKCSDVSNPTKEFKTYMRWTNNVIDEWRIQGDEERKRGLPISPFMDRENPNVLVSSQNGFIDFIIVPMYESIHNGFMHLDVPMQYLERNKSHFARLKDQKDVTNAMAMQETPVTTTSGNATVIQRSSVDDD